MKIKTRVIFNVRCKQDAWPYALDLMAEIEQGHLLGPDRGNCYREKIAGHTFEAYRRRDGGVDLRDYQPQPENPRLYEKNWDCHPREQKPHGWGEVYGETP